MNTAACLFNSPYKVPLLLLIVLCLSCTSNTDTEIYQNRRDNVISVKDKVKEIMIEDVLIGRVTRPYLIDKYLIIVDHSSYDRFIHLFDKNDFHYITSTAYKGQGPGEITMPGHVGIDEAQRTFYVSDHGKQKIFSYNLDSVLANPFYIPNIKADIKIGLFPDTYRYINNTLCIGRIIEPIGTNDFKSLVAKWNMQTGEIQPMKYEHPDIKKKRITADVSPEYGLYVECYSRYDLMTICDLNGNLKYNIYGPKWEKETTQTAHYSQPVFCGNKIITGYSGGDHRTDAYYPTKLLVFDFNGNYIQTLETEYKISSFCYDRENNRIILCMDDEIQFGYLDLDGIIE